MYNLKILVFFVVIRSQKLGFSENCLYYCFLNTGNFKVFLTNVGFLIDILNSLKTRKIAYHTEDICIYNFYFLSL